MSNPESVLQAEIRLALGRDPSLVLWRNAVGQAEHVAGNGRTFRQAFGLAKGSADLVGILAPAGRFVALEIKTQPAA